MKFYYPIFGLFIIFVIWQAYERNKSSRLSKKSTEDFWQNEADANNIRKQSLDNENYITINEKLLINNLWHNHPEDEELINLSTTLSSLMDKRILNLTGKTSTELKFMYGVANLNEVSTYDDNYTLMSKTIAAYGTRLMELDNIDAAIEVFEFGIDSLTDISSNYKHLALLYIRKNEREKIKHLIEVANSLDSLMKDNILKSLGEIYETP
ncbi:MAG: hypothetical protein IIX45_05670 [Lachnospiraceae bacterium]|nr:hypothetical protein [Lachnospiraceae bacterium]